jgi:hypothetical protein
MVLKVNINDFYQNYGTWLPKVVIILTMKLIIGGSLFCENLGNFGTFAVQKFKNNLLGSIMKKCNN